MKIRQVRNATLLVHIGGKRFLVDPLLADIGAYPGIPGTPNSERSNPLVALETPMSEILDVDAVIVTHTHPDHWDDAAKTKLPKDLPIFVQNEQDGDTIRQSGFSDIRVLAAETSFGDVTLTKTAGQHGSDHALEAAGHILGQVCGIVFRSPQEKSLYVAGDTVWNRFVAEALEAHRPDVVVLNCGDAQIPGLGSIIMNKADVDTVYQAAPQAVLVASHMEAMNHCLLSRLELRDHLAKKGMTDRVHVPDDNELLEF